MKAPADASIKPIVAKNQVSLGARRCLQLALSGMSYRMFRSSVTVAILALAVAFVAHMLSFGLMQQSTERVAYDELQRSRRLGQDLSRLTASDPDLMVLGALASGDEARIREYAQWTKASPDAVARWQMAARSLSLVEAYLEDLPVAARAVIVGDQSPQEVFARLAAPDQMALLERQLKQLALAPPLGNMAAFKQLVMVERPKLIAWVQQVIAGHDAALEKLASEHQGKKPGELLAHAPTGLDAKLAQSGFSFDAAELEVLSAFARRLEDQKAIARLLLNEEVAKGIAREARVELGEVSFDTVAEYVDDDERAAWLSGLLASAGGPKRLNAARVLELTHRVRRERQLTSAVGEYEPAEAGAILGLSERNQWLIILSFLVCAVGVANAMLMSVTERFTEIATMKCLGAMDGFVMMMFVFEAVVQGLIGGLLGLVLGGLLAVLRAVIDYGSLMSGAASALGEIGIAMVLSLLVGMLLAAVAAVGPSWLASRLAPMEAMRVE